MSSIDEPKEVTELRKSLLAWNGIPQLEMCEPHEIEKATRIFHRDGFVVLKNALSPSHLQSLKKGVEREVQNILQLDPKRRGNRGVNRYSFGGSSKTAHLLHIKEWVDLIDVPTITPILIIMYEEVVVIFACLVRMNISLYTKIWGIYLSMIKQIN